MTRAWTRAALALSIIVAGVISAALMPAATPVDAGQRSGHSTFLHAVATDAIPACRNSDGLHALHHSGADDALTSRHGKPMKRFRRRLAVLTPGVALRTELLAAGTAGTFPAVTLDPPAPYRDHARAPPPSNQHV